MIVSKKIEQIGLKVRNETLAGELIKLSREVAKLEDAANKLQCLQEAGIDNVEAYSQGMRIYYERYPEQDEPL